MKMLTRTKTLLLAAFELLFLLPQISHSSMYFFRPQGRNQVDLVTKLPTKIPQVRQVLEQVDRKNYVGDGFDRDNMQGKNAAYLDSPLPIACGQTISAPHMHAHALEEMYPYLKKSPSDKVSILDVGCGSGYLTAALGRWVAADTHHNNANNANNAKDQEKPTILGKSGNVYGIDVFPELVEMTRTNIQKEDEDLLTNGVVELAVKNGWKGWIEKAPFDAIHVGAAADSFPEALMMQLKVGGVLLIPVGPPDGGGQVFYKVERLTDESPNYRDKDFRKQKLLEVRYVPLLH